MAICGGAGVGLSDPQPTELNRSRGAILMLEYGTGSDNSWHGALRQVEIRPAARDAGTPGYAAQPSKIGQARAPSPFIQPTGRDSTCSVKIERLELTV